MQQDIQDIWKGFFDNDHKTVINKTSKVLADTLAADHLHLSGLSLLALGHIDDALARLRASVSLSPIPQWFSNAAITSLNAGATDASLTFAKDGAKRFPNDPVLHFATGNALMSGGDLEQAMESYKTAIKLEPTMNDVRLNMGNCYRRMNLADDAMVCYDAVLAADPSNGSALINRVGCLMEMGDDRPAEIVLSRMLAEKDVPEVAFMLSLIRLADGDFLEGWKLYRRRWDCAMAAPDRNRFTKPLLPTLADAAGKHILVGHEQGFGDSLQFVRYVPLLVAHARKVTILVPQPLVRLFQPIDPRVPVVSTPEAAGPYDYEVPLLDIPHLMGTTVDTIPANIPYFTVPDAVVQHRKLPETNAKIRVGLVWAGQLRPNPDLAAVDRRRSLNLAQLAPLFDVPDVEFVSLQIGDPTAQIAEVPYGARMLQPLENGFDFMDTAAIIKQLDLVISVDTAVAHLAAGLGVPTWVFSRFDGCWRWLRNREDTPWYPAMRLFQQKARHDWSYPISAMTQTLREFKTA